MADAITLTKQSVELGIKPKVFAGAAGALYPEWVSAVGDLAEYYLVPTQGYMDVKYPGAAEFWERYKQTAGKAADVLAGERLRQRAGIEGCAFGRVTLTGDVASRPKCDPGCSGEHRLNTVFGPIKFESL